MKTSLTQRISLFFVLVLALAGWTSAPARAQCTTTWTNPAGGPWTTPGNWDNGLPNAASDACITLDATYTVTLSTSVTVNSLTLGPGTGANAETLALSGGTLTLTTSSLISFDGILAWTGGAIGGAGPLTNQGLLALSGAGLKDIGGGATITNQALTTLDGTGTVRWIGNVSTFVNETFGTFDIQSDADFSHFNATGNTFTNNGLLQKSGGADISGISTTGLAFHNNGTVDAQTGELRFDGGGTHNNPQFTASSGANVYFNFGTHTITGAISGNPAGLVRMDGGATLVDDTFGATIDFGGTGFTWEGGTFSGDLTNLDLLRLTTPNVKDIGGNSTLTNQGTVEMSDTGALRWLGNISTFVNQTGATFDIQSDADFTHFNATSNSFTNFGLLQKSGGGGISGISTSGLAFNNDNGTVDAQTGELRFDGGGTHTDGVFTASSGAEVYFNTGTHTVVGTISGNPAGLVHLDSGATLAGSFGFATIDYGGTGFTWEGGTFSENLLNVDLLRLTTSGIKDIAGNSTLTNQGTVEMTDTGTLRWFGNISAFVNEATGTFDIQSDADFTHFNATGNSFTNNGLLKKSGGTDISGISTSGLVFDNNGTVDAQTGELRLDGNGTHSNGVFTASLSADVFFNAGTHTIVATISGTPLGAVRMDTGATLTGGIIDFDGTGFEWQSGNFGDVTNAGLLRLTTGGLKDILGNSTLTNQAMVEMSDVGNLRWVGNNSVFVNETGATFDLQSDGDLTHFNASGNVFTNDGQFRKSGGTGVSGVSTSGLAFNNNGTVDAQTGTIQYDGSGTHTDGVFTASAGAEVFFNLGTHTIVGTVTGAPIGVVRLDTGATLTGDTIDFGGTGFEWQSGNFGTLTNAGLLRLTTALTKDLNGSSTLTNSGMVEMTDTGLLRWFGNNSIFANAAAGVFDIQSDADFNHFNASGNIFSNEGLFKKSGGAGASVVSTSGLAFNNNTGGIVSAESGIIDVNGTFVHAAGALVQGNATFDKGASFTHNGDTGPGTSPGILSWVGTWAPNPTNSHLFIEIAGNGGAGDPSGHDQLAVSAAATVTDSLIITFLDGFKPGHNDSYTILTASSVAGTFSGVSAPLNYAFDIAYNPTNIVITAAKVPPVITALGGDTTGDEGDLFAYSATANDPDGGPLTYTWDYGDGSPNDVGVGLDNVTHTYVDDGVYTLILTVDDDEMGSTHGTAVDSLTVTVNNVAPTIVTLSGDTMGNEGDTFNYTASATDPAGSNDPLTYTWDYGDGSPTDSGVDLTAVSHVYATANNYTLTLTVDDGDGGSDVEMLGVTVTVPLTVTLTPVNPPLIVPPGGGPISYDLSVSNAGANPVTIDYWIVITGAETHDPLRTPRVFTLGAGQTFMRTVTQKVPGAASAGSYTYTINVGSFPGTVLASDSFPFEKTAPSAGRMAGRGLNAPGETAAANGMAAAGNDIAGRALASAEGWDSDWDAGEWVVTDMAVDEVAAVADDEAAEEDGETAAAPEASVVVETLPTEYALQAAYPNPFRDQATLRYDLPEATDVRVVVYDLLGREVARPVDANVSAGRHTALLDGRQLASGIYVVRMTAGERAFTQRLTLVR